MVQSQVIILATEKIRPWYPYLASFILPIAAIIGNLIGGPLAGLALFIGLVIYPILDVVLGQSEQTLTPPKRETPFRAILVLHGLLNPLIIATLVYRASLSGNSPEFWLAGFSTGIATGISGIVVGHELGHTKPRTFNWWLARFNLLLAFYPHFTTEHNFNHHRNVATIKDAASAPPGRGLWLHLLQTVPGQYVSAWRVEKGRMEKRGKSTFFVYNPVFKGIILQVIMLAAAYLFFGLWVAIAVLYQAAVSVFLLEYINYIRHYGLRREVDEKQTEMHSWQTTKRLSRWTLFELTLHPAHHLEASLPFWKLQPIDNAPTLPSGYFAIFWPCLIPPLWKRMMAPRLPSN
jgi:alkane 1-monooxygenase